MRRANSQLGSSRRCARKMCTRTPTPMRTSSMEDMYERGRWSAPVAVKTIRRGRGTRRFVILTGLSGSGKTHAIRALEDLGYFCIDNLPTQLIATMAELATREGATLDKVAIVVDVREKDFLSQFPRVFKRLRAGARLTPTLIFLEASHTALVRRFSE